MFYSLDSNNQIHFHVSGEDYTTEDILKMNTGQILKFVYDCYQEGYEAGANYCSMKIPKYVDDLLKRRTRLEIQLDKVCEQLDDWLDKNAVKLDSLCYHTGVETYVNPEEAEDEVRSAIEVKR